MANVLFLVQLLSWIYLQVEYLQMFHAPSRHHSRVLTHTSWIHVEWAWKKANKQEKCSSCVIFTLPNYVSVSSNCLYPSERPTGKFSDPPNPSHPIIFLVEFPGPRPAFGSFLPFIPSVTCFFLPFSCSPTITCTYNLNSLGPKARHTFIYPCKIYENRMSLNQIAN